MVYGYYSKLIGTKKIDKLKCPNCSSEFNMQFETYCKIDHFIFIPFVAGKKKALIGCRKCGNHYLPSTFPHQEQEAINFTQHTKKRWYHFSGLILLLVFITAAATLILISTQQNNKRMADNFAKLKPGCVIFYKKAKEVNTSMLVSRIAVDTIFVHENTRSTNGSAYQIDDSDNYQGQETYFFKNELKQWLDDGKITDVTEPQTYAE